MFGNSLVDHGLKKLTHDTQKTDWAVLGWRRSIPRIFVHWTYWWNFPGYREACWIQLDTVGFRNVSQVLSKNDRPIQGAPPHRCSSPIGHHMDYNGHSISEDSVEILRKESDWYKRGVAEAIHIHQRNSLPTSIGRGGPAGGVESQTMWSIWSQSCDSARETPQLRMTDRSVVESSCSAFKTTLEGKCF